MMIVIPMAGLSKRFFDAGFTVPKYQLQLHGESVFSWSLKSFSKYFDNTLFLFVYRDIFDTKSFILKEIKRLGILNYRLFCLKEQTKGQAETVYKGLMNCPNLQEELFIFNIDSKILDFEKPLWLNQCDGYLEVFKGIGDHWSFVLPKNEKEVILTAEKKRISNLCSDGLYYFKNTQIFKDLFLMAKEKKLTVNTEYYIAPLYNLLIEQKLKVFYNEIPASNLLFCGTPKEYENIVASKGL